jgi:hypothetical protein
MMRFIRIDAADLIRESMRQETDLADKLEHGKLDGEAFGAGEHQVDAPARGSTITRLTAPPARGCSSGTGELEDLELLDVEDFGAGEHQVDGAAGAGEHQVDGRELEKIRQLLRELSNRVNCR